MSENPPKRPEVKRPNTAEAQARYDKIKATDNKDLPEVWSVDAKKPLYGAARENVHLKSVMDKTSAEPEEVPNGTFKAGEETDPAHTNPTSVEEKPSTEDVEVKSVNEGGATKEFKTKQEKMDAMKRGEYSPSEREKNIWEYHESRSDLDTATKDFYSKNFVGRSWAKLQNWRGKENAFGSMSAAQERFDTASNERQVHLESRLKGLFDNKGDDKGIRIRPDREQSRVEFSNLNDQFSVEEPIKAGIFQKMRHSFSKKKSALLGTKEYVPSIRLNDKEKSMVAMRMAANRMRREDSYNQEALLEAMQPNTRIGKWWDKRGPWEKRFILGSAAAGAAFATGGLSLTAGGVATLGGRMVVGGVVGNTAARFVQWRGGKHLTEIAGRQADSLRELGFDNEVLKGASLMDTLRGNRDEINKVKRNYSRGATGAAIISGILAGKQYTDGITGDENWFTPGANQIDPFTAETGDGTVYSLEGLKNFFNWDWPVSPDTTPGTEIVVDAPDGTSHTEYRGNFENSDVSKDISFEEYKVNKGEGMWHVIQDGILDHGDYEALERTERSNYTMNIAERLQGAEYAELRTELGIGSDLGLDRGEVFTAEEMTKLHDAISEMRITHEGAEMTLAERADQLTEVQREGIVATEQAIENGDLTKMDRDTMGAGNLATLEAQEAAARAAEEARRAALEASTATAADKVYGVTDTGVQLEAGGFAALDGAPQNTGETVLKQGGFAALDNSNGVVLEQGGFAALDQEAVVLASNDFSDTSRYVMDGKGNNVLDRYGNPVTIGTYIHEGGEGVATAEAEVGRSANDATSEATNVSADTTLAEAAVQSLSQQDAGLTNAMEATLASSGAEVVISQVMEDGSALMMLADGTNISIVDGNITATNTLGQIVAQESLQLKSGFWAGLLGTMESPTEAASRLVAQLDTTDTGTYA